MMLTKPSIFALSMLVLAACASERAPSEAEQVRALPVVSFASAMEAFRKVCVASKPTFADAKARQAGLASPSAYRFTVDTLDSGAPVCSMRARLAPNVDAFQELRKRYGNAKSVGIGILSAFNDYPGGQLLFTPGIRNGAGEGTFQIGIVSGQDL